MGVIAPNFNQPAQQKGKTLEVRRPMAGEVLPPIFKRVYWSEIESQTRPVAEFRARAAEDFAPAPVDPRERVIYGGGKSYER